MSIPTEITALESRLSAARIPLSLVFAKAEVDRSTWSRWRSGKTDPTVGNWRAVHEAIDSLIANAANTASPDGTSGRGAGSSRDPKSETSESQRVGAPDGARAGADG